MEESLREVIELSARVIEVSAVLIIVGGILWDVGSFLFHVQRDSPDAYKRFKDKIGKALLLGLEFLVAADIIRTVALDTSVQNVLMLGLLVVVRTFLSWSLVVEIEGRWPWQARAAAGIAGRKD